MPYEDLKTMNRSLKNEESVEQKYKRMQEEKRLARMESELRQYKQHQKEIEQPLRSEVGRYPKRIKKRSSRFLRGIGSQVLALRMRQRTRQPNPADFKRNRSGESTPSPGWAQTINRQGASDSIKDNSWNHGSRTHNLMETDFFGSANQERIFFEERPPTELISTNKHFIKDTRLI